MKKSSSKQPAQKPVQQKMFDPVKTAKQITADRKAKKAN